MQLGKRMDSSLNQTRHESELLHLRCQIDKMRQQIQQQDMSRYQKSEAESSRFKMLGNQALKSGRLHHALQLYNSVSLTASLFSFLLPEWVVELAALDKQRQEKVPLHPHTKT